MDYWNWLTLHKLHWNWLTLHKLKLAVFGSPPLERLKWAPV